MDALVGFISHGCRASYGPGSPTVAAQYAALLPLFRAGVCYRDVATGTLPWCEAMYEENGEERRTAVTGYSLPAADMRSPLPVISGHCAHTVINK